MKVRDATVDDVGAIVALLNQLSLDGAVREVAGLDAYVDAYHAVVRDGRGAVVVAEDEAGVVVGAITLSIVPNLSHGGRPVAQLESAVVDKEARGRGVGEALVDECLRRARDASCFRAQLTSNHARSDAHRFWERCGFVHTHAGFKQLL